MRSGVTSLPPNRVVRNQFQLSLMVRSSSFAPRCVRLASDANLTITSSVAGWSGLAPFSGLWAAFKMSIAALRTLGFGLCSISHNSAWMPS